MASSGVPKSGETGAEQVRFDPSAVMDKASWHQMLELRVATAQQTGEPLSVLFMDINHFKDVNDTLGHETGDVVIADLQRMVAVLANSLRTKIDDGTRVQDLLTINEARMPEPKKGVAFDIDPGHIGGDEFAILCGTEENGAAVIIQRLRAVFSDYLSQPENHRLRELQLGIAIGTATLKDGMNATELLAKADEAMYDDKFDQLPQLTDEQERTLKVARIALQAVGFRLRDVPKYWQFYPQD